MDREQRIILNSFATECFRNVADADYISARVNYRLGLINQFNWSALQAIEKYLKAILLYNQVSVKNLSHNLTKALNKVEGMELFHMEIDDSQRRFIAHLDRIGKNRYLETPSYNDGNELLSLDDTVWSLRRYCRVLNYSLKMLDGEDKCMLNLELSRNLSTLYKDKPHKFRIEGGYLEKVLARKRSDEQRKALVWKNFKYGKRKKNKINNFTLWSSSIKPPHFRRPKHFKLLSEFVQFNKNTKKYLKINKDQS